MTQLAVWRSSSHEQSYSTSSPVSTGMGNRLRADIQPRCRASQLDQLSLASPGVAKSNSSFNEL